MDARRITRGQILAAVAAVCWIALFVAVATSDGPPIIGAGLLALPALAATGAAVLAARRAELEESPDERLALAVARSLATQRALVVLLVLLGAEVIGALIFGRPGLAVVGLVLAVICGLYAYGERKSER